MHDLSTYDQNVTTTATDLHSTGCLVVCFPGMTSSLAKIKQIIGCTLSDAFSKIFIFLMFLNIQIDW